MEVPASTASQPPSCQPIKYKQKVEKMSSLQINKDKLADPHKIIEKFKNYKSVSRAFGKRVLQACTVMGFRQYPALPVQELLQLKQLLFSLFPEFWKNPAEFEPTWLLCFEAIEQKCKRL